MCTTCVPGSTGPPTGTVSSQMTPGSGLVPTASRHAKDSVQHVYYRNMIPDPPGVVNSRMTLNSVLVPRAYTTWPALQRWARVLACARQPSDRTSPLTVIWRAMRWPTSTGACVDIAIQQ